MPRHSKTEQLKEQNIGNDKMTESKQRCQQPKSVQRTHGKPAEQKANLKPSPAQQSTFDKGHPGQGPQEKIEDTFE